MSESVIRILLIFAALAHLVAGIGLLSHRARRPAWIAFTAGWLALLAVFLINAIRLGEPPFGNMYHVLVVIALCFLPAQRLLAWKDGLDWPAPAFALMAVLPITGCIFMDHGASWSRMPALQSGWFVPHVATYTLAYSLAATAFLLLAGGALRWWRTGGAHGAEGPVGTAAATVWRRHTAAAHDILRLAFPFMTFGLCSGALWAEEAWGAYWQWDAKESWSLITWMLYIMALHCHAHARLRAWAPLFQTLGFAALLVTFLGVNLVSRLGSVLHSYA